VTQCCCDPEVVLAHLFALATMAVCFAADFKHNNRKDMCRFFGFRVTQRNTRNARSGKYLSNFNSPKRNDLHAIAIVNKNLVNRTVI